MKIYKGIVLLVLISILAMGCKNNNISNNKVENNKESNDKNQINTNIKDNEESISKEDKIEEKIKAMTLEEKVGQLIIAGFSGVDISDHTVELINKYKVGGFILFSRNIEDERQTLELLNQLKLENSNNDIPLFLSIDEEGGKVSRLPNSYVKIPEAIKFGDIDNKSISYELGEILGKRVKTLGFNLNFAPVLDIYSNKENIVIGSRAYGTTIEKVKNNGIQVMEGIRSTKVIPAVKHFPGHGDTSMDSHVDLPRVNKTLVELESLELIPFKKAIENEAEMVMIAHILYPAIDEHYPATMSKSIIQDVLRNKMKYEGVVVSDDMTMGAILKNYSLEEGVLQFIKSGGDIALVCHGKDNPVLVINNIIDAVNSGEISEDEVNEKVYRIIKLKEKYNLEDNVIEEINLEKLNKETKDLIEKVSN